MLGCKALNAIGGGNDPVGKGGMLGMYLACGGLRPRYSVVVNDMTCCAGLPEFWEA